MNCEYVALPVFLGCQMGKRWSAFCAIPSIRYGNYNRNMWVFKSGSRLYLELGQADELWLTQWPGGRYSLLQNPIVDKDVRFVASSPVSKR